MQKGMIVSLFALSLFSCSNVRDFPLYRETLTDSEPAMQSPLPIENNE